MVYNSKVVLKFGVIQMELNDYTHKLIHHLLELKYLTEQCGKDLTDSCLCIKLRRGLT